ncbi:MAG: PAS domain-containing protein [Deltaproteobacteria bacterium]|nr:PAS domain-containing protein [Deltaproteobacteria bacterium]
MGSDQKRQTLDSRFFESIIEHLPAMLFVKDAENLEFVRVNQAFEELVGLRRGDVYGKSDQDFFPPDEAAFFKRKDREVLEGRELLNIPEEPVHTAHLGLRYLHTRKIPLLDEDGNPEFLLGISTDITAAKEATETLKTVQRELRNREAWLRVLLHAFPGIVWAADKRSRFTAIAGAHMDRLGLHAEKSVGASVTDHLADLRLSAEPLDEMTSGEVISLVELHERALAGTPSSGEFTDGERVYEVRLEPMVPEQHLGVVGTALDITERRKLEQQRMESRLQEAQKLESLGLLAGGIAHDFNNLLVGMLGNASLALSELGEEHSSIKEHLERIEAAAGRASDLTHQMLAYSGRGRFVVEPVDLSEIVRDMAQLLEVSVPKSAALELQLDDDLPSVDADVVQLRQIVMNLITNAADALKDARGSIRLTTRRFTVDDWYLGRTRLAGGELEQGPYVVLEVRDNGRGMQSDVVDRMFDPFFTTREEGHGLGLAAVLGIMRGHGGAIRVDTALGSGTTIEAFFPASTHATSQSVPTLLHFDIGPPGRVLVVDDESTVRQLAQVALERAGFHVTVAENGLEALKLFEQDPDEFGVILLDLTMPVMDGEETFRALRELRPGVRVLLSSGYHEQEATARFAGRGLAGFLQKPYRAQELVSQVRDLYDADGSYELD